MAHFHTSDDDLPTMSARQRDRDRLDKAMAEFLSKAADSDLDSINASEISSPQPALSDEHLAIKLRQMASSGRTVSEIAKQLGEPAERCKRLAIKHRIPFRTRSFIKKGGVK